MIPEPKYTDEEVLIAQLAATIYAGILRNTPDGLSDSSRRQQAVEDARHILSLTQHLPAERVT